MKTRRQAALDQQKQKEEEGKRREAFSATNSAQATLDELHNHSDTGEDDQEEEEDRNGRVRFRAQNEVHHIMPRGGEAPPAYHISLDGFQDNGVEEQVTVEELTIGQLKMILKKRGLPARGKKSALIRRLRTGTTFEGLYKRLDKEREELQARSKDPNTANGSSPPPTLSPSLPTGTQSPSMPSSPLKPVLKLMPKKMKKDDIKKELKNRGVDTTGLKRKNELVDALEDNLKQAKRNRISGKFTSDTSQDSQNVSSPTQSSSTLTSQSESEGFSQQEGPSLQPNFASTLL